MVDDLDGGDDDDRVGCNDGFDEGWMEDSSVGLKAVSKVAPWAAVLLGCVAALMALKKDVKLAALTVVSSVYCLVWMIAVVKAVPIVPMSVGCLVDRMATWLLGLSVALKVVQMVGWSVRWRCRKSC